MILKFIIFIIFSQINEEILVNDDTIGGIAQKFPSVAFDSFSNFYVIWTDCRTNDYDPDIYIQKFDFLGNKIGKNKNLIEDERTRDIWRYLNGWGDIAISQNKIVIVYPDKRRGHFDIYCQFFDYSLNPLSPLILLNDDYSNCDQDLPKVAIAGNYYIFVWEDFREEKRKIYATILDSNFNPISPNFKINERNEYEECKPVISANQNEFIVVWEEKFNNSNYLYGRRFRKDGLPLSPPFYIFPFPAKNPSCVMDKNGNFFVCGEEENTSYRFIYLSLFDSNNQQILPPKIINDSFITSRDRQPHISILENRKKGIIIWCDERRGFQIYAQLIDSLGNKIGKNFPISLISPKQATPRVAFLNESTYLAVWEDAKENNSDIYAYHPQKGNFKVNDDFASSIQDFPCVGIDEFGNSLVVWYDHRNGDFWDEDIYGQYFDNFGNKIGNNFRINDDGNGNKQVFPWLSMNKKGRSVVVWQDNREGDWAVYFQIFDEKRNRIEKNRRANEEPLFGCWPPSFVAMNDSGDFLITWVSFDTAPYCQLYKKNGEPIGRNFKIANKGYWPFAYLNNDKSFWVCWDDGYIFLQKFDSLYQPLTPPMRVSSHTNVCHPFLIKDSNNIVWVSYMVFFAPLHHEIFCRRFSENGPISEEIKVTDSYIPCDHWFGSWGYNKDTILYIAWTDFREEGNLNVMAQKFHINGRKIGRNYCIHSDPLPFVHQWAWGSVAAYKDYLAYTWIDNRNLRSWDIYFKINTGGSNINEEPLIKIPLTIKKEKFNQLLSSLNSKKIKIFDKNGRVYKFHKISKLSPGIYFLKIKENQEFIFKKLVIF